jgi:hypothetical protein
MSDDERGELAEGKSNCLRISRSRSNKVFLWLLCVITFGIGSVEFFVMGRVGIYAGIFAVLTIVQALRTYVKIVVFERDRIASRSVFGAWRYAEYSKLLVQEDPGESIILGEDIGGRSLQISILKRDGDLNAVSELVHSRIPHGLGS